MTDIFRMVCLNNAFHSAAPASAALAFLLAFLGFFLDAACSVMLGLIFLRASRGVPRPEFV